jgi:hypothetical protein
MTRIKLGEDPWKTAKKAAIAKEITLQDFLNDAVKDWIELGQKKQL